jgi:TonB family protein
VTATAMSSRELEARRGGYRASPHSRLFGIATVLLLYVAFIAILLWRGIGLSDVPGQGGSGPGEPAVFKMAPLAATSGPPRKGGGDEAQIVNLQSAQADQDIESRRVGSGNDDDQGAAVLGDEFAQLLADDPLSGGGQADYETVLRRHIAAHSRALTHGKGRRHSGTVIVRFRVAREGEIVDARVLESRGVPLDEAALATLWRSEPLPSVPDSLDAPLEVDVPIDFQLHS